jgi:hypothetical protein
MMIENTPRNPYCADADDSGALAAAPFVGRQAVFGRIYRHVTDPLKRTAITVIGQRRIGKTALLMAFPAAFRETHVGALIPMLRTPDDEPVDWVLSIAESIAVAAARRGFTIRRLDDVPPPSSAPDQAFAWLVEVYLPAVFSILRGIMRLALLIDDAHLLLTSIKQARLPSETVPFLHGLLAQFPSLDMVLTFDAAREGELSALAPLTNPDEAIRLSSLTAEETRWLLQQPVRGLYALTDDAADAVYRASGGLPAPAQAFGYFLFRKWAAHPNANQFDADDIRSLMQPVMRLSAADFQASWNRLSPNEKLTLAALAKILYRDPLRRVDAAVIESWIVETDARLDVTAINAALRALEYREWVEPTPEGVRIKAGLMHTWLLDSAALDKLPRLARRRAAGGEAPESGLNRRVRVPRWALIVGGAVILTALIALIAFGGESSAPPEIQVTVTLSGGS